MSIAGKVIIITGAASGIGRALALGFSSDGATVIGSDVNGSGLQETGLLSGRKTLSLPADVTREADVERLVKTAMERFGRIDVLINNAGISDRRAFAEIAFEQWAKVVQVNLIGAALCLHRVLPVMLAQKSGRIINVVSRGAEAVASRNTAYSASKAGLVSLTKTVASSIDRQQYPDVLINALIPGITRTAIWGSAMEAGTLTQEMMRQMQPPEAVYPHAKFAVDLPAGGPNGRIFFNSQDYPIFSRFNV